MELSQEFVDAIGKERETGTVLFNLFETRWGNIPLRCRFECQFIGLVGEMGDLYLPNLSRIKAPAGSLWTGMNGDKVFSSFRSPPNAHVDLDKRVFPHHT